MWRAFNVIIVLLFRRFEEVEEVEGHISVETEVDVSGIPITGETVK